MIFVDEIKSALRYDPACRWWEVWLYHGLWAVWFHKFLHILYVCRVPIIPRLFSQISRCLTGIEIHPGAKIGRGVFIDHGSSVVIGETAEIGDNCLIYHGVTLGGTSTRRVKRHPTVGANTVIGCGAKIIGNIRIGGNCKIGANATVLKDVPDNSTVVGMPARVILQSGDKADNDWSALPDPVETTVVNLIGRIVTLEAELKKITPK